MRHETFRDTDHEAAQWAASSVPEHHSARSIKEPWLASSIFAIAALPLLWEPVAWAFAPLFAAMLALRLGALVGWQDCHAPEPDRWPTLTILLPVYREPSVIPELARAMRALDYPSPEIVLLVEEDDHETRAVLDCWPFRVLVVPDGKPRTKPRAVNYGLLHTRGEIVVIFDAEDRPTPDQPRRAVSRMLLDPDCAVVQAVLACDHDGPLIARLWALEYAVLFRGVLPLLDSLSLPFLLGGTSQYLRRDALIAVGAFDAHNVTEDADLSLRLARNYTFHTVMSATGEEAPLTVTCWVKQRSRWLKGFCQTTMVHWQDDLPLRTRLAFAFQLPVQLLCIASHPIGLTMIITQPDTPLTAMLFAGYALTIVTFMVAARRTGRPKRDALALPAYCCLHVVALAIAVVELIVAPSMWRKTSHGIARRNDKAISDN
ncbi:Glycosyl transferase family protein [Sulfitobacter noctilucicola]|uniref:Cellulose synthase/poly-beta-1,6-N-acetylglucosamine synthase-like glycosyltransferase n=1 Tax=Sulfitobacter noctilucicola TaxID=1342301 RepID=A0A7W6M7N5_9RHOB|nr:glycosyltransferase [Sulfitobacter noctilucicola]KIN64915.1 Glycosyl transferase family protein [Sulfitobacter noctilucicola]MBB4173944.1 cellulose synthase/poly-beta-1,6-N-acetylglucosamine synthase-like glycosyltransferase [Sulfitobacter noctilucicola]